MNYLQFAFKGPKYIKNTVFCWFSSRCSEIFKSSVLVFPTLDIWRKLRILVISSNQWNISLVSISGIVWGKVMQIYKALNFLGLQRNMQETADNLIVRGKIYFYIGHTFVNLYHISTILLLGIWIYIWSINYELSWIVLRSNSDNRDELW